MRQRYPGPVAPLWRRRPRTRPPHSWIAILQDRVHTAARSVNLSFKALRDSLPSAAPCSLRTYVRKPEDLPRAPRSCRRSAARLRAARRPAGLGRPGGRRDDPRAQLDSTRHLSRRVRLRTQRRRRHERRCGHHGASPPSCGRPLLVDAARRRRSATPERVPHPGEAHDRAARAPTSLVAPDRRACRGQASAVSCRSRISAPCAAASSRQMRAPARGSHHFQVAQSELRQ
jgi:hypothetical protein